MNIEFYYEEYSYYDEPIQAFYRQIVNSDGFLYKEVDCHGYYRESQYSKQLVTISTLPKFNLDKAIEMNHYVLLLLTPVEIVKYRLDKC